jgi:DnaJ family protein C protein 7
MLQGLFLSNICACEQATQNYIDALASAGAACALAPTYIKAHTRLAAIYTELDMVVDAQKTYQALLHMDLTPEERINVESYLDHVRIRVQAEMPIDWRKLLGVGAKSPKDALKKKYRQLALKHHPDKASQGVASENLAKARATVSSRLFNLINEAHNVLSNDNAVIKWENDRAKAKYKCCRPSGYPMRGHSTFGDTNRREHYASTWNR